MIIKDRFSLTELTVSAIESFEPMLWLFLGQVNHFWSFKFVFNSDNDNCQTGIYKSERC